MSGCEASTDQKGFTLIELLVVIVITGVLLGIALINPLQKNNKSWQLVKEPPFQPYRLPENLLIRLEVLHYQDPDNTGEAVIPDLVFFSD